MVKRHFTSGGEAKASALFNGIYFLDTCRSKYKKPVYLIVHETKALFLLHSIRGCPRGYVSCPIIYHEMAPSPSQLCLQYEL